ncbi:MAG: App1 family protein [Nannocystaceae bacterium]
MTRAPQICAWSTRVGGLAVAGLVSLVLACPGREGAPPSSAAEASTVSAEPAGAVATAIIEPSSLDRDEEVRFLPTFAVVRDGQWQVPIDAWVFEPEQDAVGRRVMLELLGEAAQHRWSAPDSEIIERNLLPFMADNERGERVALRRAGYAVVVGPTSKAGRARGILPLPLHGAAAKGEGNPPWVELEVVMPAGDEREFSAWSQLLSDEGISVVSDIDDTIKITEVHDKERLVENTFLHPFVAVPRMAEAYTRWAAAGVAFHYVSASPLPLEGALSRFAREAGFPRGTLALRPFRWIDGTALDLLEPSEDYKREVIESIVGSFERRAFVLVGDTGERDPEIYAAIARRFPGRVRAIFLRDPRPGGTPGMGERLDGVFAGLPRALWRVIVDGSGLPASP